MSLPPTTKSAATKKIALSRFQSKFKDSIVPGDRLRVLELLGEGAFAVVLKCQFKKDDGTSEIVAVKQLKEACFDHERDVEDFLSETQLLRKIRHPNVVEFKGVTDDRNLEQGFAEPCLSVIQEYMNIGSLKDVLKSQMRRPDQRVYSKREALVWMTQVAKGLEYLHGLRATVIHRDLKPENILLTQERDDGDIVAKLADFGLSALVRNQGRARLEPKAPSAHRAKVRPRRNNTPTDLRFTVRRLGSNLMRNLSLISQVFETGSFDEHSLHRRRSRRLADEDGIDEFPALHNLSGRTGSLMYMAPEVILYQNYNEKVDVFSFAVILFELLKGIKLIYLMVDPFEAPMPQIERYTEQVAAGFRPSIPEQWPEEIRKLIADCWEQDPHKRPPMTGVVKRLENAIADGLFLYDDSDDEFSGCVSGCCRVQ